MLPIFVSEAVCVRFGERTLQTRKKNGISLLQNRETKLGNDESVNRNERKLENSSFLSPSVWDSQFFDFQINPSHMPKTEL
jgi:hypothetical protein